MKPQSFYIFDVSNTYERLRDGTEEEMEAGVATPTPGAGPAWLCLRGGVSPSNFVSASFLCQNLPYALKLRNIYPPGFPKVLASSSRHVFVSICFCQGILFEGLEA